MKKIVSMLLAVTTAAALCSCGAKSSPEEPVKGFCEALRNYDFVMASSYFVEEADGIEEPFSEPEDAAEQQFLSFLKDAAKEMTYSLDEPLSKGDDMVIPVTFHYVDAGPVILETMTEYFAEALALTLEDESEEAMSELMGEIFAEKVESEPMGTDAVIMEFTCVKQEDGWKIRPLDEETGTEIANILTCNIVEEMAWLEEDYEDASPSPSEDTEEYNWQDVPAGETLELPSYSLSMNGVKETSKLEAEYYDPDIAVDGSKYVVITATVENTTKSTLMFNNDFLLYDNQGRAYEPYSDSIWYFDETFMYTDLAPNIKTPGTLVYHVPENAEGYFLTAANTETHEAYRLLLK